MSQKTNDHQLGSNLTPEEMRIATRFNRQYRGEALELPEDLKTLAIYRDWVTGNLDAKIASRFWEIQQPQKNQRCLDIGCGVSFLIYP